MHERDSGREFVYARDKGSDREGSSENLRTRDRGSALPRSVNLVRVFQVSLSVSQV